MKIAFLVVILAAVAVPSYSAVPRKGVKDFVGKILLFGANVESIAANAATEITRLLAAGNINLASKVLRNTVKSINRVLDVLKKVTSEIPYVNKIAVGAIERSQKALNEFYYTAQDALIDASFNTDEKLAEANEVIQEALAKFSSEIARIFGLPQPEPSLPTPAPTEAPTEEPTEAPAEEPTEAPAEEPTEAPAELPTEAPAEEPTEAPAEEPTEAPAEEQTEEPAEEPTEESAEEPTEAPAEEHTEKHTEAPEDDPEE